MIEDATEPTSMTLVDALMWGAQCQTTNPKTGQTITHNPKSKLKVKIRATDSKASNLTNESKNEILARIVNAVVVNETGSFSAETVWNYSRQACDLSYSEVTEYAVQRLADLCDNGFIKCINGFEPFKIYS